MAHRLLPEKDRECRDRKMVQLRKEGLTLAEIAERFGLSRSTVRDVCRRASNNDRTGKDTTQDLL
jgi:transposase